MAALLSLRLDCDTNELLNDGSQQGVVPDIITAANFNRRCMCELNSCVLAQIVLRLQRLLVASCSKDGQTVRGSIVPARQLAERNNCAFDQHRAIGCASNA